MNMMVNTSELVGNEAEIKRNSETALKTAISKLVASWEKKQATRAKKNRWIWITRHFSCCV
jgi:hypothetical protein